MAEGLHIVVCDERRIFADAIAGYIGGAPDIAGCIAAYDGRTAAGLARTGADVLVLSLALSGGMGADDVITEIRGSGSRLPILMLGSDGDLARVTQTLRLGADGFIDVECRPEELLTAVLTVADDQITLPRLLVGPVLADLRDRADQARAAQTVLDRLTERELEVLRLLVDGYVVPQIATMLDVSTTTVRTHIQHVLQKLGVHTQLAAAAAARELGASLFA